MKRLQSKYGEKKAAPEKSKNGGQRQLYILAGIVIALILIGLFALPALMPSPMGGGGPPRQGGGPPAGGGQFGAPQGQSPGQQTSSGTGNST